MACIRDEALLFTVALHHGTDRRAREYHHQNKHEQPCGHTDGSTRPHKRLKIRQIAGAIHKHVQGTIVYIHHAIAVRAIKAALCTRSAHPQGIGTCILRRRCRNMVDVDLRDRASIVQNDRKIACIVRRFFVHDVGRALVKIKDAVGHPRCSGIQSGQILEYQHGGIGCFFLPRLRPIRSGSTGKAATVLYDRLGAFVGRLTHASIVDRIDNNQDQRQGKSH